MGVEWNRVKEITLWQYDELIDKMLEVLSYGFVQKEYDIKLSKTRKLAGALLTRDDEKYGKYCERILGIIRQVEVFGIRNISELVETIRDQTECVNFTEFSNVSFEDLIVLLNCFMRWILPFPRPIRDFIDSDDEEQLEFISRLRDRGIRNNLDMLEQCRTPEKRNEIAVLDEIPLDFIVGLSQRADIARLPYVRGKTVLILTDAGYDTLDKIANANIEEMVSDLEATLNGKGKKFSRSFIDPEGAISQARVLPRVLEF
ncbi:MAG: DUF4332 domain-containing protein [Candidatus Thorarchaeota archaeon]